MAGEGVIKLEEDMPQLCMQPIVEWEENTPLEAAEVKLESELILSDYDDDPHSQEFICGKLAPNLTGETNATTVAARTLKIILRRCDADAFSKGSQEQNRTSRKTSENSSNAPVMGIKAGSKFKLVEKNEARITSENYLIIAGKGNDKHSVFHPQASAFVKIEKEEGITHELVASYHSKNLENRVIVKREVSELHSDHDHPSSVGCTNGEISHKLKKGTCSLGEDKKVETALEDPSCDSFRPTARVKVEDQKREEVQMSRELVSSLQGQFESKGRDEKPLLKVIKSEAGARSEWLSDMEHLAVSEATNAEINGTIPKTKISMKLSLKKNSSEKQYCCSECPYICCNKTSMTYHIRVHTGERPYECKECPKKFRTKSQLSCHMITHTNKRLFKCAFCVARFKSKEYLTVHLRRHSDERPYSCTQCPAKFKVSTDLTVHKRTHSSSRRFECAHCSRRSKSKNGIKRHLNTHFENRSYVCTWCRTILRRRSDLKRHFRMKHTSERPFECTQCGFRFKRISHLKDHLPIHSDNKPFLCPHCPATFRCNNYLKRHIVWKHINEKIYTCAHCSKTF